MRLIIFSILTLLLVYAGAEDSSVKKLRVLIDNVENSRTLRDWHENKERLESIGYQIWFNNKDSQIFCKNINDIPYSYTETFVAWDYTSPSVCSERIKVLYDMHLMSQQHLYGDIKSDVELETCSPKGSERKKLGPTKEVVLDTTGGPRLVRGDLDECVVALTFDDGPHPMLTPKLIEILEVENVKANFFTVGRNIDRYPIIANDLAEAGQIIGNHSHSHKNFPKLKYEQAITEIKGGFNSLLKLWDYTTPFFRFPYGAFTKQTRAYNKSHNVAEFFWNMDTRDWDITNRNKLLKKIFMELNREKRGILLFHDVQPQTIDVMPQVLIALRKAGYKTAVFIPEDLIEDEFPK